MNAFASGWAPTRAKYLFCEVDQRARGQNLPLLSVSIHHGVIRRDSLTDNEPRADDLGAYKLCDAGDVVLNRMRAFQGAVGVAREPGLVSPDYAVLRPSQLAVPAFLHHLTRSQWFVEEMSARLRGIGNDQQGNVRTPRINVADLSEIRVALPPHPAQLAIAEFLDAETERIDALTVSKRRMVELLAERWQTIMHDAAAGLLVARNGARRPTSVPWLTTVPSHWEEGHLKLIARLGTGHTPSRSHPEWWADLTIPWITTGEVAQMRDDRIEYISDTRESISELGMANSSATLHPTGTVVLCRTASAGYSAIMARDMATSQDFATWTCGPLVRPRFLLLCLRAMRRDLLGRLAIGSTHKTIYMPDIESIKIPIPPVDEQDALVVAAYSEHGALDRIASRLATQIDLLQERRQALITATVTGQVDVSAAA